MSWRGRRSPVTRPPARRPLNDTESAAVEVFNKSLKGSRFACGGVLPPSGIDGLDSTIAHQEMRRVLLCECRHLRRRENEGFS